MGGESGLDASRSLVLTFHVLNWWPSLMRMPCLTGFSSMNRGIGQSARGSLATVAGAPLAAASSPEDMKSALIRRSAARYFSQRLRQLVLKPWVRVPESFHVIRIGKLAFQAEELEKQPIFVSLLRRPNAGRSVGAGS